jgi:threonyl-tRNA synthetase
MIKITLKDDVIKEYEKGIMACDVAKDLSQGLYKAACACKINGKLCDLRTLLNEDCKLEILTFSDADGKKAFWHTASHVLAQAVKRLFPSVKLAIGPSIDNGFYYDFESEKAFTPQDIDVIEKEIKTIVKEGARLERFELPVDEAIALMKEKNETYKVILIEELAQKGENISFYRQGDFVDLCAGPHLLSTSPLKAVKLTQSTGAYWKGDANNAQLCRIYGTAFPKAAELEEYLLAVEEAKKRDHNIIGRQLKFFTTNENIGQGLPLLMPKGAKVIQILQRYIEDLEEANGYLLTKTPLMAKNDLYKISGHWDHYKDGMFILGDEEKDEEVFALRPMTCPFQFTIYKSDLHSYRDLPLRYGETSTLFRNESSGEMHGLIRVRQFTISEGHLVVTKEQLEEEFRGAVALINTVMKDIGIIDDITYRFSKWDESHKEKYIGEPELWEETQNRMREILKGLELDFVEQDGEAAFYGPKLDIQMKNVHGKEDTIITVQIDFALAERFDMTYTDADGQKKHPYVIHRTSIGCYERTLALLIEKYAGALPLWISPIQAKIIPIGERQHEAAKQLLSKLKASGIRAEIDDRNEKMGYKIREAQLEKIPFMLILGDKEVENSTVSVRSRRTGDEGSMTYEEIVSSMLDDIANKK